MSIYKRGGVYWYKFMWNGELIRESTKQGNDKKARNIESAHRTSLANGLVGIREKKPAPALADFLKDDFVPFVETKHAAKPATAEYYTDGANMICKCDWASDPLDKISDQHAQHFAAKYAHLSPSRINCGLRTLRRALNLAFEWGKLDRPVKITLAKGERQRDTVLTDGDWQRYIAECPQPWRDAAIIIRGTGMRPGEVFALRWENIHLNGTGGLIQVTEGKTKAARRMLPMVPAVYVAMSNRYISAGKPEEGWVFPATSIEGHLNKDTAKDQHKRGLDRANAKAKASREKEIKAFPPYVLRHTALTQLAEAGCDVFTLARIAGHSSITITQRYVHPQADAIDRAFQQTTNAALAALPPAGD
ncbi:MAG TPA: site-specific integrase [Clostridia bacterium]|nr:site-specific integrase [Clostridia bacterium]